MNGYSYDWIFNKYSIIHKKLKYSCCIIEPKMINFYIYNRKDNLQKQSNNKTSKCCQLKGPKIY